MFGKLEHHPKIQPLQATVDHRVLVGGQDLKQEIKRFQAVEAKSIPLGALAAPSNRQDVIHGKAAAKSGGSGHARPRSARL